MWKESTPEFKQNMSARAKMKNETSKQIHQIQQQHIDEQLRENDRVEKLRGKNQIALVDSALKSSFLCPSNPSHQQLPSLICPATLADHAAQLGVDPLPLVQQPSNSEGQIVEKGSELDHVTCHPLDSLCSESKVVDAVHALSANEESLHGLGDSKYGVSKSVVDHLLQTVPGFVRKSNDQFRFDHGYICEKIQDDFDQDLADEDDIEFPQSCEDKFGRYCVTSITNSALFNHMVEMNKSIARIMSKQRTIKLGKQVFLSPTPDTFFPVLLVTTDNSDISYARLACRVSFSPLDIDWIHCKVQKVGDDWHLQLEGGCPQGAFNKVHFTIDGGNEWAAWFSMHYQPSWKCILFLQYEVETAGQVTLVLKPSHKTFCAEVAKGEYTFGDSKTVLEEEQEEAVRTQKNAFSLVNDLLKNMQPPKSDKKNPGQKSNSRKHVGFLEIR